MDKQTLIKQLLPSQPWDCTEDAVTAFACSNIALVKYWGKRQKELNLPVTSSLSISLQDRGSQTSLRCQLGSDDLYVVNGYTLDVSSAFARRVKAFLDLFRPSHEHGFYLETDNSVPLAAGLASSASGYAALVLALNELFQWQLDKKSLSIIARMGSGSASRSLWHGFVEWHRGNDEYGLDSYAAPLSHVWPELRLGLLLLNTGVKAIPSRQAMSITQVTSPFYSSWPTLVEKDLTTLKQALDEKDFNLMASTAEANALAMHACMHAARPPINYWLPETLATMQQVWQLRDQGMHVYFTQDAGPNLKLLFLHSDEPILRQYFPEMQVVVPFAKV